MSTAASAKVRPQEMDAWCLSPKCFQIIVLFFPVVSAEVCLRQIMEYWNLLWAAAAATITNWATTTTTTVTPRRWESGECSTYRVTKLLSWFLFSCGWTLCPSSSCYYAAEQHAAGRCFSHWGCNKSKVSHYSSCSQILIQTAGPITAAVSLLSSTPRRLRALLWMQRGDRSNGTSAPCGHLSVFTLCSWQSQSGLRQMFSIKGVNILRFSPGLHTDS